MKPWVTPDEAREVCAGATNEPLLRDATVAATSLLYALSGRQFPGLRTFVARPTRLCEGCGCLPSWAYCQCAHPSRITLKGGPVTAVGEVKEDGVVLVQHGTLDEDDEPVPNPGYRLDQARYLTRLGDDRWRCCYSLTLDPTEVGTLQVTYTAGVVPPEDGKLAAAVLACELVKASTGDESCRLSPRVSQLVREGVSVQLSTSLDSLREGLVGLPEVDLFLTAHNPEGLRRSGRLLVV